MKRFTPILTLVAVGIVAAVLWRIEVEAHGWHGLIWVSYFHWSIPAGVLMFATWLAIFSSVQSIKKRLVFSIVFLFFAAAAYQLTYASITMHYARLIGPFSAFPWWFILWYFSIFLIIPLVPVAFLYISKFFQAPITLWRSALSLGLYALSFPMAMLLLGFVNHRGQPDMLHAIKSGFVIPFLIVSFGLPFVFRRNN